MVKKKHEVEENTELTKARLIRAEKLTDLLKDEGVSWVEKSKLMEEEMTALTGDVFVSAGAVSYCGPFTGVFR